MISIEEQIEAVESAARMLHLPKEQNPFWAAAETLYQVRDGELTSRDDAADYWRDSNL